MSEVNLPGLFTEMVSSSLETMFFTLPLDLLDPADIPEGASEGDEIESRLSFHGTPSGVFHLRISVSGARLIAAAFLGEDEDSLSRAETEQVVCELANMLCGSMVSRLESDRSIDLSAPELVPTGTLDVLQGPLTVCQSFELERGFLTVSLRLETA
jgi:CheY-specific phosphatase CheX